MYLLWELNVYILYLQQRVIMEPSQFSARTRPSLEERLEMIISGAALMADSSCTRDDRRERIVKQCNVVRQALQDLLTEYENNVSTCTAITNGYRDKHLFADWAFCESASLSYPGSRTT